MKNTIIGIIILAGIGLGAYFIFNKTGKVSVETPTTPDTTVTTGTSTTTTTAVQTDKTRTVIGTSVEGRPIVAYHFGTGSREVLFVGGIHGGYEWNTALVAYDLVDYFKANLAAVPANVRVTVIPVLNPDGLNKVVGTTTKFAPSAVSASQMVQVSGRFNGNTVDLNRNFDCDWQATGKWQDTTVSGGSTAFSEPESLAMKNYVMANNPAAVIVWYSAAGGVYSSSCHNGVSAATSALTKTFATGSGYEPYQSFDFYVTTGDMTNWLAKQNIPAISVLLTNHTDVEWDKNLGGVKAVLSHIAQ